MESHEEVWEVDGVITGWQAGEVYFDLDTGDTDVIGDVLAQVEVTQANGDVFVPGTIRLTFLEKLG